jgi:hypothetical protein
MWGSWMADLDKMHKILSDLKRVASDHGVVPTRNFYREHGQFSDQEINKLFPTFGDALKAAGIAVDKKKTSIFKYKREVVDGFTIHDFDLDGLFKKSGNPETLKVLGQSDTHVEHMDERAVDAYLKFAKWYDPDVHLIGGDFLDAEGISHWPSKSLEPRDFAREVKEARALLNKLVKATPNAKSRLYIMGNHEHWIEQAMLQLPGFFHSLAELGMKPDLSKLLELDHFGYHLIPLNEVVRIGKLHIIHGWYTGRGHAAKHLKVFKANVSYFHLHDEATEHDTSVHGRIDSNSNGCLCKLNPHYTKGVPTNWKQGFPIWEFKRDGSFRRYFIGIDQGEILYNGKRFKSEL